MTIRMTRMLLIVTNDAQTLLLLLFLLLRLQFQFQLQLKSRAGCEHGNHRWRSYRGRCACHDFRMHVYSMPPQESINAAEQTPCCQLGSPRSLLRPIDECLDSPVPDNSMFAKKNLAHLAIPSYALQCYRHRSTTQRRCRFQARRKQSV